MESPLLTPAAAETAKNTWQFLWVFYCCCFSPVGIATFLAFLRDHPYNRDQEL